VIGRIIWQNVSLSALIVGEIDILENHARIFKRIDKDITLCYNLIHTPLEDAMLKPNEIKKLSAPALANFIAMGYVALHIAPDNKTIQKDLKVLENEMLIKGFKVIKKDTAIAFEPYDYKAKSEVTMDIPSPASIINGKSPAGIPNS